MQRSPAGGAALLLLVLAGCGGGYPAGRGDAVAEAGSAVLTPDQAATWVAKAPSGEPTAGDASYIGLVWIDYTLLTQAAEQGGLLADSAMAADALALDVILAKLNAWHDTLTARRPRVTADRADSLYEGGYRVFQQILIPVADQRDARQVGAAQQKAESLLAVLGEGGDFVALARAHSGDTLSARDDGFLPVGRRSDFVPEFTRNAWRLQPGQLGGMGSRYGLHLVRRPPLDSVRDRLLRYADSVANRRADSVYVDSLRTASGFAVPDAASDILRGFFADPATRTTDTRPMATWQGGQLTLAEAGLWVDVLPPTSYLSLRGASDVTLREFAREIGTQYLMLQHAEASGIQLTAAQWTGLRDGYRRGLRESLALVGLSDTVSGLAAGQAAGRVAAMLDGLTTDQTRWRPLPAGLAGVLRSRAGYRLHREGAERAAELAAAAVAATRSDTAARR